MTAQQTIILDKSQIAHKLERMAWQIYENNVNEKEIVLAGIASNGYELAKKLKTLLKKISPLEVRLCKVVVNKEQPTSTVETSLKSSEYRDRSIVVVDDVLHSGTTLIYGVKHFLNVPLKQVNTAVLVDRNHKRYPVKADFKGISLSTSLNENVKVILEKNRERAVLE